MSAETLSPRQRLAIIQLYWSGHSPAAIAGIGTLSEAAVRSTLFAQVSAEPVFSPPPTGDPNGATAEHA